jgi:hypothetical protein
LEIVVGEIAKGYANALARLCECLRLRKEYAGDLELASVADTVMKALAEERPVEAGPVRVEVRKKILGRSLRAFLRGQEVDPDELLSKISQARSRAAGSSPTAPTRPYWSPSTPPTTETPSSTQLGISTSCPMCAAARPSSWRASTCLNTSRRA